MRDDATHTVREINRPSPSSKYFAKSPSARNFYYIQYGGSSDTERTLARLTLWTLGVLRGSHQIDPKCDQVPAPAASLLPREAKAIQEPSH